MYPAKKFICNINIIVFHVVNKTKKEINGVCFGSDGLKVE